MSKPIKMFGSDGVSYNLRNTSDILTLRQILDDAQRITEEEALEAKRVDPVFKELVSTIIKATSPSELERLSKTYSWGNKPKSISEFFWSPSPSLDTFIKDEIDFATDPLVEFLFKLRYPDLHTLIAGVEITESLRRFHLTLVPDFFADESAGEKKKVKLSPQYRYTFWKLLYVETTSAEEDENLFSWIQRLVMDLSRCSCCSFYYVHGVTRLPMLVMFLASSSISVRNGFLETEWRDAGFLDLGKKDYVRLITKRTTSSLVVISLLRESSYELSNPQKKIIFLNACSRGSIEVIETLTELYTEVTEFFYHGVVRALQHRHLRLIEYLVRSERISSVVVYNTLYPMIIPIADELALSLLPIPSEARRGAVNTAFIAACRANNQELIVSLLEDNRIDLSFSNSAAFLAALAHSTKDVVKIFLDDPRLLISSSYSSIQSSLRNEDSSCLHSLITHHKFPINRVTPHNLIKSTLFLMCNKKDTQHMKVLLDSPLSFAGVGTLSVVVRKGNVKLIKLLLADRGARFLPEVESALTAALEESRYNITRLLLKHYPVGVNPQADLAFLEKTYSINSKFLKLVGTRISPATYASSLLAKAKLADLKNHGSILMANKDVIDHLTLNFDHQGVDEVKKYRTWLEKDVCKEL